MLQLILNTFSFSHGVMPCCRLNVHFPKIWYLYIKWMFSIEIISILLYWCMIYSFFFFFKFYLEKSFMLFHIILKLCSSIHIICKAVCAPHADSAESECLCWYYAVADGYRGDQRGIVGDGCIIYALFWWFLCRI